MPAVKWNANLYQSNHDFVSAYGKALLESIPDNSQLEILDLGCGTGDLTAELARKSPHVIGVDSSPDMIEKARTIHPELDFRLMSADSLEWENRFDLIFSNAVLHWITDQQAVLRAVHRALKAGGGFLCEFGAQGNIALLEQAFPAALSRQGICYITPFTFPSAEEYSLLLEQEGFHTETLIEFDRPTPLKGGWSGLRIWMQQFYAQSLASLSEKEREDIFDDVEQTLKSKLWDDGAGQWAADYRRIRHFSTKNA